MDSCRLIRIQDSASPLYAAAEKIWMESFPECERRDASAERLCVDTDSRFVFNAVVYDADSCGGCISSDVYGNAGGQVIGLFSWWNLEDMVYGEHFAMSPAVRGKGIGEAVFRSVAAAFRDAGLPFVFEVETPDEKNPVTIRRINFYIRCGMQMLDYPYFQPPYHPADTPIPMRLMSGTAAIDPAHAAAQIRRVYPRFLSKSDGK